MIHPGLWPQGMKALQEDILAEDSSFGQYLIREHQGTLRRAEARERLSIEEQVAWGWLDERAGPMHGGRRRPRIRLRTAWVRAVASMLRPA